MIENRNIMTYIYTEYKNNRHKCIHMHIRLRPDGIWSIILILILHKIINKEREHLHNFANTK